MQDKHITPSLEKGIRIYQYIGQLSGGVTQAEIVSALDVTPTTCYRILNTFTSNGWLVKRNDNTYDLAFGILPYISKLTTSVNKLKCLNTMLVRLSRETGLTAKVSIAQGTQQVSILRQNSEKAMAVAVKVGSTFPIIEGSVGGALLCDESDEDIQKLLTDVPCEIPEHKAPELVFQRIKQCRQKGFCLSDPNNRWNIGAMSTPLRDDARHVIAALTVVGFKEDFAAPKEAKTISRQLLKTADECETTLKQE